MRLLLRVSVVGTLIVIFLILLAIRHSRHSHLTLEQQETDEAIKLLLATGQNVQAEAGLQQDSSASSSNSKTGVRPNTELTFNVAIVLVVSLLSVALLITGICCIIIVAVTLNPGDTNPNYHNYLAAQNSFDSDNDHNPLVRSSHNSGADYEFDDSGGEFGDMCVDKDQQENSYSWDPEAQVWSSTGEMRLP